MHIKPLICESVDWIKLALDQGGREIPWELGGGKFVKETSGALFYTVTWQYQEKMFVLDIKFIIRFKNVPEIFENFALCYSFKRKDSV
jgi:hypothetical protein